jgi:Leucine-rich repeat (LRR) protein
MYLRFTVLFCTLVVGEFCFINSYKGRIDVDCVAQNLSEVPANITNALDVTSLDLSENIITVLGADAFRKFPHMMKLNLSLSNVRRIHGDALRGLKYLTVLDLSFNPVITHETMPVGLFEHTPSITHLNITGNTVPKQLFVPLDSLTELVMTADSDTIPYELLQLKELKVLTFAYGNIPHLKREIIQPFADSNIQELAIISSGVITMDAGTFDNFSSLQGLNLACNPQVNVNDLIENLSNSSDLRLTWLIIDLAGSNLRAPVVLSNREGCKKIWEHLNKLSMRGINWLGIDDIDCLGKVDYLSIGFNSPFMYAWSFTKQNMSMLPNRYIDASHLFKSDVLTAEHFVGCSHKWVPGNSAFFPHTTPESESIFNKNSITDDIPENCRTLIVPRAWTYLKFDHLGLSIWKKYKYKMYNNSYCDHVLENNVRYFNMSSLQINRVYDARGYAIYGLHKIEIVDISYNSLIWSPSALRNVPIIQEMYNDGNPLGRSELTPFPRLTNLRILSLSYNEISFLKDDVFSNLPRLSILNLRGNVIQDIDWIHINLLSLSSLDLRQNHLGTWNVTQTSMFETHHSRIQLDIRENPLQCGCDNLDFVDWIQKTTIDVTGQRELTCRQGSKEHVIYNIDLEALKTECKIENHEIALSVGLCTAMATIIMTVCVLYKYRWLIKWKLYNVKYYLKTRRSANSLPMSDHNNVFSTFIVYPYEDDEIRRFVFGTLRGRIEIDWQRRECFIRGRNDPPACSHIDAIMAGILSSQTAIWVVCPNLFVDRWCENAMHFAFHHMGAANNILVIMENRFEEYQIPSRFASLINPNLDSYRLRYTDDEDGQRLFWAKLSMLIPE